MYYYNSKKVRNVRNNNEKIENFSNKIINLDINSLSTKELYEKDDKVLSTETKIQDRNIIRTKLNCQRLAKANAKYWESFITLTYAENMQDVLKAKKDLEYFVKNIKKVHKDFKYIAIPEFQKRGSIHFHLLTNLSKKNNNIIYKQKDNEKYYHIKYWSKGFSSVDFLQNDIKKIIGYISKYMTKDCDNRLFNIKRYTSSQNLIKPIEDFLDISTDLSLLNKILKGKDVIYSNTYYDNENNEVTFVEYHIKGKNNGKN